MAADRLETYRAKRDFTRTSEPAGEARPRKGKRAYLIQKHEARNLHFDFRLEYEGVLKSWAVPRGPSMDPADKRLAVRTEDHPVEYGKFEGVIPKGQYGGGTVMLWDVGTWTPIGDPEEGFREGKLKFELHGKRIKGAFALIRLRSDTGRKQGKENWLLIKERDEHARENGQSLIEDEWTSVRSGRPMDEIAESDAVWHSNKSAKENADALKPVVRRAPGRRAPRTASRAPSRTAVPKKKKKRKRVGPPSRLPSFVAPQLATLVDAPPDGADWLHEIKYDGYRAIAAKADDRVRLYTRSGLDWTEKFAAVIPALEDLPCDSVLLDGEIAVADRRGHTDFGALQDALAEGRGGYSYYVFDLLELNGENLRVASLRERKRSLAALLAKRTGNGGILYSDHLAGNGAKMYARACDLHLEGIISKRADAPYRSGRTTAWLKSKCGNEQEFVIIGWRPSDKKGRPFSSLLLAVKDDGELRYAGRVGTGYSEQRLDDLADLFRKLARTSPAAKNVPASVVRHARFIEPELVAEVEFRGWTREGLIRQGAFKGLRSDKPASTIVRETPMAKAKAVRRTAPAKDGGETETIEGVRVTHPDRILFPDQGITKRELIQHYVEVADLMLPHIVRRPISLVRCPRGAEKDCFFQKHASPGWPDEFKTVRIKEKSGTDDYLYIEDLQGLVASVQMGAIELHLWGCHVANVEKPDRMIFDLDPDEGLSFGSVREAALELRQRLKKLKLESFPMATGGKGIHVVVPLKPKHSWEQHRDFAEAMARLMAADDPARFVATMSKAKRKGKIFADYLRNTRGATAIAPYSSRARKGAYFAVPLSWAALAKAKDAHPLTIGDKPRGDPWKDYAKIGQTLPSASGLR